MEKQNIYGKLQKIQTELKAPKNLYNNFGKYKYRNAEDICEAVKPFLDKYSLSLILSDEIVLVGERYYIKAIVKLIDCENGIAIETSAFARESFDKKGMDDSQITGSTSSYARKYALNGLFLLDDTKDADSDEYHEETNAKKSALPPITYINNSELKELKELCIMAERTEEYIAEAMKVKSLQNIQSTQFGSVKAGLLKIINANKEKEKS